MDETRKAKQIFEMNVTLPFVRTRTAYNGQPKAKEGGAWNEEVE